MDIFDRKSRTYQHYLSKGWNWKGTYLINSELLRLGAGYAAGAEQTA